MKKTSFKVMVRPKHIAKGHAMDSSRCPIALALLATRRLDTVAVVGGTGNSGTLKNGELVDITSRSHKRIAKFISDFDAGARVKPFSFVATLRQVD
jgi:hypothetical protein